MTNPDNPNIINFDLWKQAAGGRHQIGTLAGFKSEQGAGFLLECMAGFVGIRTPEGRAKWTLRLLESKVVELNIVDHASDNTIGRVLKKMSSSLILRSNGSSRRKQAAHS